MGSQEKAHYFPAVLLSMFAYFRSISDLGRYKNSSQWSLLDMIIELHGDNDDKKGMCSDLLSQSIYDVIVTKQTNKYH